MKSYSTKHPVQYAPHITTNIRTGEKKVAAHIVEKEAYTIDMLSVEISTATTVTRFQNNFTFTNTYCSTMETRSI